MPITHQPNDESINEIGGELLEQSGFETETPDTLSNLSASGTQTIRKGADLKEAENVD
jgi:hypothetical protein